MREYTKEWLRKSLIKIIETTQEEVVTIGIPPPAQHMPKKETSTSN
jgi:hypothetical protein